LSGQLFPALSQELKSRTGIDNGFFRCGGLEFVGHASHLPSDEWYGLGVPTKQLSEKEAADLEPALAPNLGPAILIPGMAQLRNPWHMQALRAACLATQKVVIREETAVQSLVVENGHVKGIRAANEELMADRVLLAAGAWTDRLLEPLGVRLKIEPVRGQIALLNPGQPLLQRILVWGTRYMVPRPEGRVLIGSTEEHAGFVKITTAEAIQDFLAVAVKLVPALASAALEKTWAGFRPSSPDGLPFLGSIPGIENLLVAAGHFRAGIQLSPGSALLLKEMILGEPPTMPMDAFRLDR
jgi:glycine oxidase